VGNPLKRENLPELLLASGKKTAALVKGNDKKEERGDLGRLYLGKGGKVETVRFSEGQDNTNRIGGWGGRGEKKKRRGREEGRKGG